MLKTKAFARKEIASGCLVSVLVAILRKEREKDDSEIKGKTPILEIEQIVFHALANGSVAAPAVDLGPSGNAHLETMTIVVSGYFVKELFHETNKLRPRTNHAHVPF